MTASEASTPSEREIRPGWGRFLPIWLGQVVSLLGSGMTSFALGLWVYQRTGAVTQFSLIMLCSALPPILLAPLAGSLADRWNRRRLMIVSDMMAGFSTLAIAALLLTDQLAVWHIYASAGVTAVCGTFQSPAYLASVPMLVPDRHLPRANGMIQLGHASTQILAPLAGGAVLGLAGLEAVLIIDGVTFAFAFTTLLLVRLPGERKQRDDGPARQPLRQAMRDGLGYLWGRPELLALLGFLTVSNFLSGVIEVLVTPLALSLTSVQMLGFIMTTGGLGMLAGSLIASVWGGPRRRIRAIIGFEGLCGLSLLLAGLITWVPLLPVLAFAFFFGIPIINSSTTTILQRKVPPALHGRVFALTGAITQAAIPLAYSISGPLADGIFEPAMMPGGVLAAIAGPVVGTGPGRGIALMFVAAGVLTFAVCVLAAGYPPLRRLEQPGDGDAAPETPEAPPETSPEDGGHEP